MIIKFDDKEPKMHKSCFIAGSADIIGDVELEENVNIWFGVVLRGDKNYIRIGSGTNVQDNTTVHISGESLNNLPTIIGRNVTIGHNAIIHACTINDNVLIGMGSIILDGAVIGKNTIVGAGTLVPPNKHIPEGVLVIGSPCKVVRELSKEEIQGITDSALDYVKTAEKYK